MAYISLDAPARPVRRLRYHAPRHLLSTNDIDAHDVDELCRVAEIYEMGGAKVSAASGQTIALLFFQPSTRTRAGFQVAALSLGAHFIGFEDMSASRSNARSGETLEDCAAVFSRLCDAIVLRHHEVGAARRMASTSVKPVINAGDGWNEHPTQALIDLFSLRRGLGKLRGKSICFGGDPRGRTVRSLLLLLRYEGLAEILFCPPPHVPVPDDLLEVLRDHQIRHRTIGKLDDALTSCDAIMMAPYDMSDIGEPASSGYVSPRATPDSHMITPEKLDKTRSRSLIYHPLPRLDEIDPRCDHRDNAMYFEQVRLSKYMRMAVLDRMLSAP